MKATEENFKRSRSVLAILHIARLVYPDHKETVREELVKKSLA